MPATNKNNQQDNNGAARCRPPHRNISSIIVTASRPPVAIGTRPPTFHVWMPTTGFPVFDQTARDPWIGAFSGITPPSPPQTRKNPLEAIASPLPHRQSQRAPENTSQ